MRQVTSGQVEVLLYVIGNNQRVTQTQIVQLGGKSLGFRRFDDQILKHDQTILTHELGEDGAHCGAVHLLIDLLRVILRARRKSHATRTPDRTANSTGTSSPGTLLTPRLLAAATHIRTSLLCTSTLATSRHISGHDLMNQGLVKFFTEGGIGNGNALAATSDCQFHHTTPQAFTAGLIIRFPPVAPGTEPLISSRLRSASTRTISRL